MKHLIIYINIRQILIINKNHKSYKKLIKFEFDTQH